jgi:putative endonuclease
MFIYKIECLIGCQVYIGQTTKTLQQRILMYRADISTYKKGKYKARSKIIRALAKYGIDNFVFFIIDKAKTQEELDLKERFWISIYNSNIKGIGYNIQLGGFGVGKHSDETKKIMSDKKKGTVPYNKGKVGILSGETIGNAKLTQLQANQIREDYKSIRSSVKLSIKYGVSKPTILSILNNKRYIDPDYKSISDPKPWFVYIIKSLKDNSLYTGATVDVFARLKTHNDGRGARYTKGRTPFVLEKQFGPMTKSEALSLEYKIKQLPRNEKLKYEQT